MASCGEKVSCLCRCEVRRLIGDRDPEEVCTVITGEREREREGVLV